ncbi:MAG: hypothetical protein LBD77_04140 [Bifidobacteriaceae bacterium]|jgi:hypothetical protein|nr:hypothetical protein [Bifidobacteriaceae bacterium]
MDREERQRAKGVVDDVGAFVQRAAKLTQERGHIAGAQAQATHYLLDRLTPHGIDQQVFWRALNLDPRDDLLVTAMARGHRLPPLSPETRHVIDELGGEGLAWALSDAKSVLGARRMFSGKGRKDAGVKAVEWLTGFHNWLYASGFGAALAALEGWHRTPGPVLSVSSILSEQVGFMAAGYDAVLIDRSELTGAAMSIVSIDRALHQESEFRAAVTTAGNTVRQTEARKLVAQMPVEKLKEATSGQLRINALTAAGFTSVQQVLDYAGGIVALPSVGETTANRMIGAARTIWQTTVDEMPVRIDVKSRSAESTKLLAALRAWDAARSIRNATSDLEAAQSLRTLTASLGAGVSHVIVIPEGRSIADLRVAVAAVEHRASLLTVGSAAGVRDPWDDFMARPADYYAMLSELGFLSADEEKSTGDLPAEILEAIRDLKLDTTYLKASLRGYQSFGARFAVVQRKVIIGDEMGLGKTVESLAVLTHLRAKGAHHFLVICPAAVVTNWIREVTMKSDLRAHRIYGAGRDSALTSWIRNGGVAVTTYDSLGWLEGQIPSGTAPACLVFDEAHYIKNSGTHRTRRSLALIRDCERSILLTGTPPGEPDRGVSQSRRLPAARPHGHGHRVRAASVPQASRPGVPTPQPRRSPHRTPPTR